MARAPAGSLLVNAWDVAACRPMLPALVLAIVAGTSLALRLVGIGHQSAYMDEATFILTGRILIEEQSVYAGAPTWTYGSFLWPLIAGLADTLGGLLLVRIITAGLGTVMAVATTLATVRLAPASTGTDRSRWLAGLAAGLLMGGLPTAVGVGRFGTYDALAGALFMLGIVALLATRVDRVGAARNVAGGRRGLLIAAAMLLFGAFLAKYLVAVYFPFVCLALLAAERRLCAVRQHLAGFVVPLAAACALYFVAFRDDLLTLLSFSTSYTDLTSDDPLRQYIRERPELWVLMGLAALGVRRATWAGRAVMLGGAAVILAFQGLARADFDFWKHSIYLIFFLAPLAGLALASPGERLLAELMRYGSGGHPRRRAVTVLLAAAAVGLAGLVATLDEADRLVTFYPNLNPSLQELGRQTASASTVLTDDSALRYYLYPRLDTGRVTDPFFVEYRGLRGMDGYRAAIRDRNFDVVVLDGGIGPVGRRIRSELRWLIERYYRLVYSAPDRTGAMIQIYRPRRDDVQSYVGAGDYVIATTDTYRRWEGDVAPPTVSSPSGQAVYTFENGDQGWGGQPEHEEPQPGRNVAVTRERTWNGRPVLKLTVTDDVATVAVRGTGRVSQVRAQVLVEPDGTDVEVPVGMIGFDEGWRWHDDGFKQVVPVGRWTEISWEIAEPGIFRQLGLKFPAGARVVYLGQVELEP